MAEIHNTQIGLKHFYVYGVLVTESQHSIHSHFELPVYRRRTYQGGEAYSVVATYVSFMTPRYQQPEGNSKIGWEHVTSGSSFEPQSYVDKFVFSVKSISIECRRRQPANQATMDYLTT